MRREPGQTQGSAGLLLGEALDFSRLLLGDPFGLLDAEPQCLGIFAAAAAGVRLGRGQRSADDAADELLLQVGGQGNDADLQDLQSNRQDLARTACLSRQFSLSPDSRSRDSGLDGTGMSTQRCTGGVGARGDGCHCSPRCLTREGTNRDRPMRSGAELELPPLSIRDWRRETRMASSSSDSVTRASQSTWSASDEEPLPDPTMVLTDDARGGERTGKGIDEERRVKAERTRE